MQFFILLTGVLVFVFFQFEKAPLHFNPYAVDQVKSFEGGEKFQALEIANDILYQEKQKTLQKDQFFSDSTHQAKYLQLENQVQRNRSEAKAIIETHHPQIESNDRDYVFLYFILNYMPKGLIGLLLAVIFCAAMSSSASEINALSATTVVDLYKRFINGHDEKHYVLAGKGFTLLWGMIAIAFAWVTQLFENLIQLVNIIGSLFYGTILGIFLLAIFLKSIRANAVFYAALFSEVIILIIYSQDWVPFLWLNFIGALLTVLTALIIQTITKNKLD